MQGKRIVHPYKSNFTIGNTEFSVFYSNVFVSGPGESNIGKAVMLHNHFFNEIILIKSGEGFMKTENEDISFCKNHLIYIPKSYMHSLNKTPDFLYYSIGFSYKKTANKNKMFDSFDKFDKVFSRSIILPEKTEFLSVVEDMIMRINNAQTFSYFLIQALLQEIILLLYEEAEMYESRVAKQSQPIGDFNFAINQRLNNPRDKTKLKDVAKDFHISERQLARIIKKQFGVSFTERKNQLRIETAKQLLKNSDASIEKIAEEVAFYDTRAFTKQFVQREGMSPAEYRKTHTK